MHYAWIGFLKPEVHEIPPLIQVRGTDFLNQPLIKIIAAGPLRDASGKRAAMMMVFDHNSREEAESFVSDSPYLQADLYENDRLYEYDNEVG